MFYRFLQAPLLVVLAFLSVQPSSGGSLRKVNVREVELDLQASISHLLGGTSSTASRRIATIEASTWQTFQALPKNEVGRLAPSAVRYIVHSYFAKEHGWLIKGLEQNAMQNEVTEVHDMNILQDKVPMLLEQLLEVRQGDRGLALNDVVTMVAVLEQLMLDESMTLLEAAYRLNELPTDGEIDESNLHKVLQSYLVLFGQGSHADLFNVTHHQLVISRERPEIQEFEHDAVLNFQYANRHRTNPFKPRSYSFESVSQIMEELAQQYGKWQNHECRDMKAHLKELDPEGSGRVPLSLFYAQPKGSSYHFSESVEYLRKIGALDESSTSSPQVRIANYVAGPSNCIASSSYYAVCCLSECDGVLSDLEHSIQASTASAEKILSLVHSMSFAELSKGLPEKLHEIAARHGGEVPLHSRLFAQWLHFAFPSECPFPSVVDSEALTASHWIDGQSTASEEEQAQHLMDKLLPIKGEVSIDDEWSHDEVLPLSDKPAASSRWSGSSIVRTIMQLAAVFVALRSAWAAWQSASFTRIGASKKNDGFVLPLHC